jgi:hypothetical protein
LGPGKVIDNKAGKKIKLLELVSNLSGEGTHG